jgi:hypothetical protein
LKILAKNILAETCHKIDSGADKSIFKSLCAYSGNAGPVDTVLMCELWACGDQSDLIFSNGQWPTEISPNFVAAKIFVK